MPKSQAKNKTLPQYPFFKYFLTLKSNHTNKYTIFKF